MLANIKRSRPGDCAMRIKSVSITLALLASAALAALIAPPVARLDAPDVYAIKDAQIVTGAGKTIAKGTVVFRNGSITDVGETVQIPADARIIDGAGMTVYPGIIDSFTSLGLPAPQRLLLQPGREEAGRPRLRRLPQVNSRTPIWRSAILRFLRPIR